jgi:hypothetical protein
MALAYRTEVNIVKDFSWEGRLVTLRTKKLAFVQLAIETLGAFWAYQDGLCAH